MTRISKSLIIGLLATALTAGTATAQDAPNWADKTGGFGVGAETTLGGSHGLNLRYYINSLFGFSITFGFDMTSSTVDNDDADVTTTVSSTAMDFGLYAMYKLAYWQRGHLSGILGVDIQTVSSATENDPGDDTDSSGTDLLIGLGLHGEYFPTQYLSLFGQVGVRLDFIGENEVDDGGGLINTDDDLDYSGMDLSIAGDLLGAFGFTVWFN